VFSKFHRNLLAMEAHAGNVSSVSARI